MAELQVADPQLASAPLRRRGRLLEDFAVGQTFVHHWGRTFLAAETVQFSALTLSFNPAYFNLPYAQAEGHPDLVVNPWLVFLTVFGLSVEDLSEAGQGAFLGVEELVFHRPVYPDMTVVARSTVVAIRDSSSRPAYGIITWHTEGTEFDGQPLLEFERTNLVIRRSALDASRSLQSKEAGR